MTAPGAVGARCCIASVLLLFAGAAHRLISSRAVLHTTAVAVAASETGIPAAHPAIRLPAGRHGAMAQMGWWGPESVCLSFISSSFANFPSRQSAPSAPCSRSRGARSAVGHRAPHLVQVGRCQPCRLPLPNSSAGYLPSPRHTRETHHFGKHRIAASGPSRGSPACEPARSRRAALLLVRRCRKQSGRVGPRERAPASRSCL